MNKVTRHVRAGFTMIELLVAIAILGILAAIAIPNVMKYLEDAKKTKAKGTLKTFETAITSYYLDTNQYPAALNDLVKAPADEKARANWQQGGYLKSKEVPLDPWDRKYQYKPTPEAEHPYELYTYGKKGKGAPKNEWIDVWKL